MNAELTAENRPACVIPVSMLRVAGGSWVTHEDKGGVQVFVILVLIISVKLGGFLSVDGEKVGAGIVGPQWLEKILESRMEARSQVRNDRRLAVTDLKSAHHFGSS